MIRAFLRPAIVVAGMVAVSLAFAGQNHEPARWLVTVYRAEGGIDRSWVVERVERDGCSVTLPEIGITLVGGAELVRVEPWR